MVTQNTVISFEQLVQDFDSLFRQRVFRLETLNRYDAENEREPYAQFLAGRPADLSWREPWQRLVRDVRASGRIMQRVHVVREPVSDYVRFEMLRVYPANVEAGEDVRIAGQVRAVNGGLGGPWDFWLFDDDRAVTLHYDSNGCVADVEMVTDAPLVAVAVATRDLALRIATPLAQYVADHNITEGRIQAA